MARARIAAMVAMVLILVVGATAVASPGDVAPAGTAAQAVVAWPPSTGLLVAEVVTGGASASDEYVELTNASTVAVDLAGLEVAYVTSSGSTVTRKASWTTAFLLDPGRHLLIANGSGTFAASADATYSGGFAATGGGIVLRPIGGQPIDAVAWGDASSGFVEGAAAPAPVAGSSIERRPGGAASNTVDTNDNAADLIANASPIAQNLASAPGPVPSPSPSAAASPSAAPTAVPSPTAAPTATPEQTPLSTESPAPTTTPSPTPMPTGTPTPSSTLAPTPAPTATATPVATPAPTPTPTPTPEALPAPIDSVRLLADGMVATVEGVLTTDLGSLEAARSGFVQDATGGIAIYLDGAFDLAAPAGSRIRATGIVDSRFGQRTLRAERTDVQVLGEQWLPTPLEVQTGAASEPLEGLRLQLSGTVTEAPSSLSDGLGVTIDDGSGEVRVIVGVAALGDAAPARGSIVVARGPLGQRDSSGTGLAGYRLHATLAGEFELLAAPSPSPTPSPTPSPPPTSSPTTAPSEAPTPTTAPSVAPTPTSTPTSTSTPTATPVPTASPSPITIAEARLAPVGRSVVLRGVVMAEAGRLGTPALFAIGDATGGIPVKLPDGVTPPARGALLEVRGALADPYGQTELRPASGGIASIGTGTVPSPLTLMAGAVGEANEGRLGRVTGTIETSAGKSTSNDITFSIKTADGVTLRVLADASAGLDAGLFRKGAGVTLTGVIGQRASRKGSLDGYRLWLRDRADVVITAAPAPTPSPTPRSGPTPTPRPSGGIPKPKVMSVRSALLHQGQPVTVEGVLTVNTTLLDASGRRTILEDATAAIEVYLDGPDASMRLGARVRVTGTVGVAWGAPRLRADETKVLGTRPSAVHALRSAPTAAVEWRLVRLSGTIAEVHRSGDRWTADLQIRGARVPISGLAGSGIASTDLSEGRPATVTGIVKRPYPTATDRRFAIVPRQRSDIVLGKVAASPGASAGATGGSAGSAAGTPGPGGSGAATGTEAGTAASATDIDLRDLEAHAGERVRVGGLVASVQVDGVRLDDGTSEALVVLDGDAAGLLGMLQVGDALNATGTPDVRDGPVLVVTSAADVELVGDLGGADPSDAATVQPAAMAPAASPAPSISPVRAVLVPGLGLDSFSSGLGTLILVSLASVVVTLARRQRSQRVLRSRILARLEAIGRAPGPSESEGDRPAEPPFGAQTGPELGRNVRGSA